MSGNISSVCVLCVLLVSALVSVSCAPVCTNGQAGCHGLSLASLFDRLVQHSGRMHGLSTDLHSHFEQNFLPSKNQIGRVGRTCHTSNILTPNGKENAQRMAREELTQVIMRLLLAWRDPLWHFHHNMAAQQQQQQVQQQRDSAFSSDAALEMSDMVHELRKGVEKVAEKMQILGLMSGTLSSSSAWSPEVRPPPPAAPWHLMSDYDLLYCFRRDSNKVQSYLKILKCRIVPEHGC